MFCVTFVALHNPRQPISGLTGILRHIPFNPFWRWLPYPVWTLSCIENVYKLFFSLSPLEMNLEAKIFNAFRLICLVLPVSRMAAAPSVR